MSKFNNFQSFLLKQLEGNNYGFIYKDLETNNAKSSIQELFDQIHDQNSMLECFNEIAKDEIIQYIEDGGTKHTDSFFNFLGGASEDYFKVFKKLEKFQVSKKTK